MIFFYNFNRAASKLCSLWHVGYLLDDFFGSQKCSRACRVVRKPARCHDSIDPLRVLGICPPTLTSLLCCIDFSLPAILHFLFPVFFPPVCCGP